MSIRINVGLYAALRPHGNRYMLIYDDGKHVAAPADFALTLRTLRAKHVGPDGRAGGGVLSSANGGADLEIGLHAGTARSQPSIARPAEKPGARRILQGPVDEALGSSMLPAIRPAMAGTRFPPGCYRRVPRLSSAIRTMLGPIWLTGKPAARNVRLFPEAADFGTLR